MKKKIFFYLIVASGVRLLLLPYYPVMSPDGVTHIEMGKGLFSGEYFNPENFYYFHHQPLYAFLIGLFSGLISDLEVLGKIISLLAGVFLIIPVYLLTSKLFNLRVAEIASLLTAFSPYLARYSLDVLPDSLYVFLFTLSLYWGWKVYHSQSKKLSLGLGAVLALSYLTRPEGIGLLGILIIFIFFFSKKDYPARLRTVILILVSFFLFSFPYILYLKKSTGKWMLTKKLAIKDDTSLLLEKEKAEEMNPYKLLYGLDQGKKEIRKWSVYQEAKSTPISFKNILSKIKIYPKNLSEVYIKILPRLFPPLMFILAGAGLVAAWPRDRKGEVFLALVIIFYILSLCFLRPGLKPRYFLNTLALLNIWAAKGVMVLEEFSSSLKKRRLILPGVILATLPITFAPLFGYNPNNPLEQKYAGLWLKKNTSSVNILSSWPQICYYAGAKCIFMPYAPYKETLDYARYKKVDYLVIDERTIEVRNPYMAFLLNPLDAAEELELVYDSKKGGKRLLIYKLK